MLELLKCGGANCFKHMLDWFQTMQQKVPVEWRDALIMHVPKKGDLSVCETGQELVCWMSLERFASNLKSISS